MAAPSSPEPEPRPTHAGGVVVREAEGTRLYLLVRPRDGRPEWLLPKGHIEAGETAAQAALREVREEAGVHGEVVRHVATTRLAVPTEPVVVAYYLIRYVGPAVAAEARDVAWCACEEALARLTFEDTRDVLRAAEALARGA